MKTEYDPTSSGYIPGEDGLSYNKRYLTLKVEFINGLFMKIEQKKDYSGQQNTCPHGLVNYIDTKAKYRHLKNFTCGSVYLSLQTGDTFSHVGIFDPAL